MKITAVNALPIDRYLFVQIKTDAASPVWESPARGVTWKPRKRRWRNSQPISLAKTPAGSSIIGTSCTALPTFAGLLSWARSQP